MPKSKDSTCACVAGSGGSVGYERDMSAWRRLPALAGQETGRARTIQCGDKPDSRHAFFFPSTSTRYVAQAFVVLWSDFYWSGYTCSTLWLFMPNNVPCGRDKSPPAWSFAWAHVVAFFYTPSMRTRPQHLPFISPIEAHRARLSCKSIFIHVGWKGAARYCHTDLRILMCSYIF